MPGEAVVTINENQWNVSLATTYIELVGGLSGVPSIPAGTGMLFVLGEKREVTVDTSQMMFPIDIIFISESLVVDVASNIQPGYLVTEETPCDMFLEVNAGEAAGVEAGDSVATATIQQPGVDWSSIISFAIPLVALGFVCAMVGGMARLVTGSSSSGAEVRRLGSPRAEKERAKVHEEFYGTKELPPRGRGLAERGESAELLVEEPHSMWLTLEQRKGLEEKYGAVAVRWAEEATKPSDLKGAEAAAEYYYKKLKEALGLGHLSPELSEEKMRRLREVLGLPADVAEILKIHQETGYVP
ncbi:hypothetical protein ES705_32850 [subsurface metagenome]